MAILSSLFGSPGQQQPAVGAQPLSTAEIPKQLAPYYTDILGKAQALYDKRVEEGFKPYEGPTIAQFTPEQQATFTGIAGLQGQVAPKFAEAEQLTRDAAAQITGEQIQEAMSPYQQAVTDIEKRESQKAFEQNVLPKIRAAQIAQGSFGGTRGTLLEAQALADQQRGLADIQAKGSAAAFTDARKALEAERTRMGQGATQLANIAPAALKTGLAELGAQQTVGEAKQRQTQTALDEAYRQFLQEKQEPYEAMQKYQAVVTGAPLTTTQFAPPPAPGPSLGQTLIGGLGTAAGLYGAFTGNNPLAAVGLAKGQTGGGIADLIQAQDGTGDETIRRSRVGQFFDKFPKDIKFKFSDFVPFNLDKSLGSGYDYLFDPKSADKSFTQIAKEKMGLQDEVNDPNIIVSVGPDGTVIRENIKTGERQVQESEEATKTKGGDEGGPMQGPPLPKGGLSSLETKPEPEPKADQPPPPTAYQLREQDIASKEQGILDLLKDRKVSLETEKTDAADAAFKRQSANIAKAFAEFATKGGQGNILQKAIGTAGDNVDRFMASSDKYREDIKNINKAIRKGDMDVAQFEYQQVKDKAARDDSKEARDYTRKTAKATAEYQRLRDIQADKFKSEEFQLKRDEINQKIRDGKKIKPSDRKNIKEEVAFKLGYVSKEGGGYTTVDGAIFGKDEIEEIENLTKDIIDIQKTTGSGFDSAYRIAFEAKNLGISPKAASIPATNPDGYEAFINDTSPNAVENFANAAGITIEEAKKLKGL